MGKGLIIGLSAAALVVVISLSLALGYIGFSNDANRFEVDIKAKYSDNQNVYDNGWKKVVETAQVPEFQVSTLKELYDSIMKNRYGATGSKAMLQFIQEQNPTIDQSTFRAIQQTIESFRNEFAANQTRLVSIKQTYESFLTATTSGRFYNTFGHYPHIDLSVYDIVTSEKTQDDFRTKKSEPLTLNKKK